MYSCFSPSFSGRGVASFVAGEGGAEEPVRVSTEDLWPPCEKGELCFCPQSPSLSHLCSCLPTPPRGLAPWLRCRFAPRGALAETRGGELSPSQLSASEPPWCFQPFLRGPQMDRGQPLLCYCLARGERIRLSEPQFPQPFSTATRTDLAPGWDSPRPWW